ADSMYLQNPADVTARSNYYQVPFVPYSRKDGAVIPDTISTVNSGNVRLWNQSVIDSEYAIPAPFILNLTHSFNSNFDSVFISATMTCTQNITMKLPVFQCALLERYIHFSTPVSGSGMSDFYSVMRKMYPSA